METFLLANASGCMHYSTHIIPSFTLRYKTTSKRPDVNFVKDQLQQKQPTALLLEGGADVDPARYNEDNIYSSVGEYSRERDMQEWIALEAALDLHIPVIGNCRGHQLAAVFMGGDLWQDIEIQCNVKHSSTHYIDTFDVYHEFRPFDMVNSYHHQAVRTVPSGAIVQASFKGINEALYYPKEKIFTVQWHPEFLNDAAFLEWVLLLLRSVDKDKSNDAAI